MVSAPKVGKRKYIIHCRGNNRYNNHKTDNNTKEILDRYLIRLDVQPPNICYQYNITAPLGEVSQTKLTYQNTSTESHTYEFYTSHPEIARIVDNTFTLGPGYKIDLPLVISSVNHPKQARILIYIFEADTGKHEEMLFVISFPE